MGQSGSSSMCSNRSAAARGATGWTSAARRGRWPSRSATSGVPEMLARVLAGRGVELDEVEDFLDPTIRKLMPDPYTADARWRRRRSGIADAVARGEKVAIFGDYDVDGATSAALLAWLLRHCGLDPLIHIPDRMFEGYGPNVEAIRGLAGKGATLLVTVDCGTTSLEPLAEAQSSAWTWSSSITIRPARNCPRSMRWSTRTGSTISPGSAISPPSAWC